MDVNGFERHAFPASLECRYLLHAPAEGAAETVLAVALHGYGSDPETMLRLTVPLLGANHIVAAIQAPNQHYAGGPSAEATAAYNWGIRDHWESTVRLHHDMVRATLAELRERFQLPAARCLLMGFSQPVGLNYRFIATHPDEAAGVLGICGGVPRDWEDPKYKRVDAALLHISRDQDEFYPNELVTKFPDRLRTRAGDVEFHLIPGAHRFPSKAGSIVQPWLERVFGR